MSTTDRCTGFRLRGLNGDCDRLAVQSTHAETWLLGKTKSKQKGEEVSLEPGELKVLRVYNGTPVIEITPLGDTNAVLVVDATQTRRQAIRAGRKLRLELHRDEAVVIHDAYHQHPNAGFGPIKQV